MGPMNLAAARSDTIAGLANDQAEHAGVVEAGEVLAGLTWQAWVTQTSKCSSRRPARPVARSSSHSSVLPLRGVAQTRSAGSNSVGICA